MRAFKKLFAEHFPQQFKKIRFPQTAGIGIKPASQEGTARLVKAALRYAIENRRRSVTLVHKGNIMKFTEGAFRDWGYAVARRTLAPWTTRVAPGRSSTPRAPRFPGLPSMPRPW